MIILGIHDYNMTMHAWLDPRTSNSFLKCFESMKEDETHVVLYEHNYNCSLARVIDGVHYHFTTGKSCKFLYDIIDKVKPDIILHNSCKMDLLNTHLTYITAKYPRIKNVIRFHHCIRRILHEPNRTSILSKANEFIIADRLMHKDGYVLPFGIDIEFYTPKTTVEKKYDFVCSAGNNVVKNLELVNNVMSYLSSLGYRCKNVIGVSKEAYRDTLQQSKIYFTFTLSEGGCSRTLLEALAAGCLGVAAEECDTILSANLPIKLIKTGAYLMDGKVHNEDDYIRIAKLLISYLDGKVPVCNLTEYDEKVEIEGLKNILTEVYRKSYPLKNLNLKELTVDQIFTMFNLPEKYKYGFSQKMVADPNFDIFANVSWIQNDIGK